MKLEGTTAVRCLEKLTRGFVDESKSSLLPDGIACTIHGDFLVTWIVPASELQVSRVIRKKNNHGRCRCMFAQLIDGVRMLSQR